MAVPIRLWKMLLIVWLIPMTLSAGRCKGDAPLVKRIDASLKRAGRFLVKQQSPDGAWRSKTYGCFKDGPSLTPQVLSALFFMPQTGKAAKVSYRKGASYLVEMIGSDGRVKDGPNGLMFPALTASSASRVVVLHERTTATRRAQAAWLKYFCARRLSRALGWLESDPEFGGWGFALAVPRKPASGRPKEIFFESNMVATIFALGAVRSAKVALKDPMYEEILTFVERCQNFADDPQQADVRFDDGGFFFIPGDAAQNKAGIAGTDAKGRERYHSYGTMTADGLRALIRCGLPRNHPRVIAAKQWLEMNFSVKNQPGTFAPDREVLRGATYYYWCWAIGHAFVGVEEREIETKNGRVAWAEALAEELLHRQQPNGSWQNKFTDAKEDDPLVATSFAAAALALCWQSITGEDKRLAPKPAF
jgi:hypothetical protein